MILQYLSLLILLCVYSAETDKTSFKARIYLPQYIPPPPKPVLPLALLRHLLPSSISTASPTLKNSETTLSTKPIRTPVIDNPIITYPPTATFSATSTSSFASTKLSGSTSSSSGTTSSPSQISPPTVINSETSTITSITPIRRPIDEYPILTYRPTQTFSSTTLSGSTSSSSGTSSSPSQISPPTVINSETSTIISTKPIRTLVFDENPNTAYTTTSSLLLATLSGSSSVSGTTSSFSTSPATVTNAEPSIKPISTPIVTYPNKHLSSATCDNGQCNKNIINKVRGAVISTLRNLVVIVESDNLKPPASCSKPNCGLTF